MLHHIAKRLLRASGEELLRVSWQVEVPREVQAHVDAPGHERGGEVREGRLDALALQVGRVDLDDEGPQVSHRARYPPRPVCQGPARMRAIGPRLPRGRRHAVGKARQLLHHAVVEVGRNPSPLQVGCVDGPTQQTFALLLPGADAPSHGPGERTGHEPERADADEE